MMNAHSEVTRPARARRAWPQAAPWCTIPIAILAMLLLAQSIAMAQVGEDRGVAPLALKGKLLFQDDFTTPTAYTKQVQPVRPGWGVKTAHAEWNRVPGGVQSSWKAGHMPVLVYEGTFNDAVIEVDFRFKQEAGKWGGCRVSATNQKLNPRAYAASVWASSTNKGRPTGMVLEHDEWSPGVITNVDNKKAEFKPDTWYTLRLELIGDRAQATCNGVTVYGTHEKFGLMPKTSLWLGSGTASHEFRNLRVYEATLNPNWKPIKSTPVQMPVKPATSKAPKKEKKQATPVEKKASLLEPAAPAEALVAAAVPMAVPEKAGAAQEKVVAAVTAAEQKSATEKPAKTPRKSKKSKDNNNRTETGAEPLAIKGKLLFEDKYQLPTSYTKQAQPVGEGWKVKTSHADWAHTETGVKSIWSSGHMPVLVYQGEFRDAVIEVDFRFKPEEGKWGGCRLSATNSSLNPRAYAVSVWANSEFGRAVYAPKNHNRPVGLVLEHDEWAGPITNVDSKSTDFKPNTWYSLRLELIGGRAQANCNGVTVYGTQEKFGLTPKTAIWLGSGTAEHEFRNLRVYEATLNPNWKPIKSTPVQMLDTPKKEAAAAEKKTSPGPVEKKLTEGWTQVPLKYDIQKAWNVDVTERHRYDPATDTHTLWVLKTDKPHAPPPNHTGPRTELRFRNDYLTGQHMFTADIYIVKGSYRPCIMQIWGSGLSATTMMMHVNQDGVLECGGGNVLLTDAFDKWFNLKVIHDTAGKGEVRIYINDVLKATRPGRGYRKDGGGFYFKCGVYGVASPRAEARFRNIKIYEKPAPAGTKSNEDVIEGLKAKLPEREKTLRFPDSVSKSNPYVEKDPDPAYRHASEAAYNAFRNMKYGVRIHWGLYSMLPAARESWTFLEMSDAERQDYQQLYKKWNPQGFDAEEWMKFFERAGFRSFAITTKHHEGFSLWDTKARVHQRPNWTAPGGPKIEPCDLAYSVMDTPFKRDIIKELCDAGHRHNMLINLYFSHSDWYDTTFRPYGRAPLQYPDSPGIKSLEERQKRPAALAPAPTELDRAMMMARHRQQLRELLTNYGKIDMVCLDIQLGPDDWAQLKETITDLRKVQPDVMFRNRGIGNYGDYYTPERVVPGDKSVSPMPWMVIYPLGTNFSWEGDATKYKGAKWVVDNLVDSVAKGGNFMVGIGPDGSGRFHPAAIAQLEEVGAWLKINGEGIFGTHERPGKAWKEGESVRFTAGDDGKHVYAILLKRPGAQVKLSSVTAVSGSKIELLGREGALPWAASDTGLTIDFPGDAKESLAYVLKIEANK